MSTKKQTNKMENLTTTTNTNTEDQKYITARLCMLNALEIGRVITLEEALILTDY